MCEHIWLEEDYYCHECGESRITINYQTQIK